MKILSLALLLMATLAFVLLGCSDNSSPVVPSTDQSVAPAKEVTLAKGAVVRSVTGDANILIGGKMGVLTLNARLYADGKVDGIYNFENTAFNPEAHTYGRIVALTFYENYSFSNGLSGPTALFWCELDLGGGEVGYMACFVVDKGQVNGGELQDWAGPTTDIYPTVMNLTPQQVADQYPFFFVPIEFGNIVIH